MSADSAGNTFVATVGRILGSGPGAATIGTLFAYPRVVYRIAAMGSERLMVHLPGGSMRVLGQRVPILRRSGDLEREILLPACAASAEPADVSLSGDNPAILGCSPGRILTPSGDSAVWATPENRYSLSLVNLDGEVVRQFDREPDWFLPDQAIGMLSPYQRPPNPLIREIREDEVGRLWVLIWLAKPDWVPQPLPMDGYHTRDQSAVYDTVLEVIDLGEQRVIAQRRLWGAVSFLDGSRGMGLWVARTNDLGVPTFHIWSAELSGRN